MHPVQARKNTPDINRAKATINKSDDPEGLRRPRLRDREREREREREIERERERQPSSLLVKIIRWALCVGAGTGRAPDGGIKMTVKDDKGGRREGGEKKKDARDCATRSR